MNILVMLRDAYGYCHATGCVYTGLYMLPALKDFLSLTVFMPILRIFICPSKALLSRKFNEI